MGEELVADAGLIWYTGTWESTIAREFMSWAFRSL